MLRRILILLLLGAATTIATSWLLAAWIISSAEERIEDGFTASKPPAWLIRRHKRFGATALIANPFSLREFGPEFDVIYQECGDADDEMLQAAPTAADAESTPFLYWHRIDRFGWPCRAMEATRHGMMDLDAKRFVNATHIAGIRLSPASQNVPHPWRDRVLPLRPLWFGFICNTFIYAFCWLLAMTLIGALRGYRRCLRGTCPRCACQLNFDFRDGCAKCGWRRRNVTQGL